MQKLFRLGLLLTCFAAPVLARDLGDVVVAVEKNTIPVRVTCNSAELQKLALAAFNVHGRYRLEAGPGAVYDIRFSLVAPNQVRVDILKGRETAPAFSQTVSGTSGRNALLRAADIAVEKTNGQGLRGFFTARLAFVAEGSGHKEICTADLFIGEAKQLTHDRALALSPRWSPDGSRIIYTSFFQSGFPDIYVIDPATGGRSVFARFKGTNTGGRYSPNGQRVAMVLSSNGSPGIWVASASGGTPVKLVQSEFAKSSPCWSPDSSRLVFAQEPGPSLYVVSAGGGTPQRLVSGYRYTAEPDWSRTNPNKIACTVFDGGHYQIAVYDFTTQRAQVVSQAPFDAVEPSWLADGRHLVYTARDRSSSVLCVLDTETGKSTHLTTNSGVIGAAMQPSVLAQ
jgi:TolB protein